MQLFIIALFIIFLFGILGIVYVSHYNSLQYKKKKKDYLKEYVQLKDAKISNFDLDRKLKEAVNIIQNLKNDYPELQDNPNMEEIVMEIKNTEEKLSAAILYYNRYTNELNELIRKFPSNVVAKFHHFKIKHFFDGKDMTDDDLLDFKL